jgi:hypothetical protein
VGAHVNVWKATSDVDGNAETIKSDKSLFTTDACRLVIDINAIPIVGKNGWSGPFQSGYTDA